MNEDYVTLNSDSEENVGFWTLSLLVYCYQNPVNIKAYNCDTIIH